jgi:GxGYxYP putative glycoside hydrolase C-terminal domain/GxGYxYP third domain/GxGYxYP_N second domain/FG-GAP-like repeat/GxGYxYP_N 1st domain
MKTRMRTRAGLAAAGVVLAACSSAHSSQPGDAPPAPPDAPLADAPLADAPPPDAPPPDAPPPDAPPPQTGMTWPPDHSFPSFSPITSLDVIDGTGRAADVAAMLVTLQGVVDKTRPRIYVSDQGAGDQLWLSELGVPTTAVTDPMALVAKYRAEVAGVVITDDAQPDTLNLATTIAGQTGAIVASPALATTLTAAPYGLPVIADLRAEHFASKLDVYQYELDHYSAAACRRMIIGLTPSIPDHLRDYAVATGALVVWLDPRDAGEKALLDELLALLQPDSPYLGWWADEPTGVAAAASHGVPVFAADWSSNLTVLGGSPRGAGPAPAATAPPPLEPKVYVAMFMSDGDNLQEDQHLIPLKWASAARGAAPIGWTISPALVDVAPVILRYYRRTATVNDVLVAGPSGLGYTYPAAWPAGAFDAYARQSGAYLDAAGLRVITVWNNGADLADADGQAYVQHVPGLVGMTIQDESQAVRWPGGVPLVRMNLSYGDTAQVLEGGIDAQLGGFTGAAPRFVAIQGNMNSGAMDPGAFAAVQDHYASNHNVVFVRPDHFFQLLDVATHPPQHRVFTGDFDGDGDTDVLMYYGGDGNWWLGRSDGTGLTWQLAGNTSTQGNLLDGTHYLATGDFDGNGKTDLLYYARADGTWWMGLSDGDQLTWHQAAATKGFGDLLDGNHRLSVGDYDGDGKTDVLFYFNGDGNWWLGRSDGTNLTWTGAGNSKGFGDLLDGSHALYDGDFDGDGKRDVMFYYQDDGAWWLGRSDGAQLAWTKAADSKGFGNLLSADHRILTGDFDHDGKTDVLFHYAGDGAWWMGTSAGTTLTWHQAGTTTGADLLDWSHRLYAADLDGDHDTDVLAYDETTGDWTVGRSDGDQLTWQVVGNTAGYGNLADPSRLLFVGDFDGDGTREPLFYDRGDGDWWMGRSSGTALTWHQAGNTSGFGDLTH